MNLKYLGITENVENSYRKIAIVSKFWFEKPSGASDIPEVKELQSVFEQKKKMIAWFVGNCKQEELTFDVYLLCLLKLRWERGGAVQIEIQLPQLPRIIAIRAQGLPFDRVVNLKAQRSKD